MCHVGWSVVQAVIILSSVEVMIKYKSRWWHWTRGLELQSAGPQWGRGWSPAWWVTGWEGDSRSWCDDTPVIWIISKNIKLRIIISNSRDTHPLDSCKVAGPPAPCEHAVPKSLGLVYSSRSELFYLPSLHNIDINIRDVDAVGKVTDLYLETVLPQCDSS